jgi:hypothetical protein
MSHLKILLHLLITKKRRRLLTEVLHIQHHKLIYCIYLFLLFIFILRITCKTMMMTVKKYTVGQFFKFILIVIIYL